MHMNLVYTLVKIGARQLTLCHFLRAGLAALHTVIAWHRRRTHTQRLPHENYSVMGAAVLILTCSASRRSCKASSSSASIGAGRLGEGSTGAGDRVCDCRTDTTRGTSVVRNPLPASRSKCTNTHSFNTRPKMKYNSLGRSWAVLPTSTAKGFVLTHSL